VAGVGGSRGGRRKAALAGLTEREVDVLTAIGGGLSNAEISARFRISPATVKTHVNHLLAKTGMRDRAQLVGYAFRQDLVR
jgi:DNA-binding NarL/FixJ family response regulator